MNFKRLLVHVLLPGFEKISRNRCFIWKHPNVLSWLALAHALPPVTIAPFQSVWQPSALEAERPKQIWLSHYFQSADSTLGVGKQAAQAIVPTLVPKGLCRNCKRREEIIYIWMRNTLPSAPISPNSIIQEAIKEKCIFFYYDLTSSFITI